jgi:RNA-binding protein YlmH
MSNKFSFNVGLESVGTRLDKFLAQEFLKIKPEITRTKIQNFIAQKLVKNSQNLILENDSYKIKINDEILMYCPYA